MRRAEARSLVRPASSFSHMTVSVSRSSGAEHRQRVGERALARLPDLHRGAVARPRQRDGDGAAVAAAAALDEPRLRRADPRAAPRRSTVRASTRASASIGSPPR